MPLLSEGEFGTLMCALRTAAESTMRPISFREAQQLPVDITNVHEGFAYAENATCRIINSLKVLPDFREIPLSLQMSILKVLFLHSHAFFEDLYCFLFTCTEKPLHDYD